MRINYRLPRIDFGSLRRVFRTFSEHLRPHKGRIILAILFMLGTAILTLLRPWPLKIVFDYILLPVNATLKSSLLSPLENWSAIEILFLAALSVLILAVLKGVFNYSYNVISQTVGHRLVAEIRLRLFSHVQRLPLSYHDYRETGDLMTRMTGDISLVQDLLVSTVITLGTQVLLLVSMLAIMFVLNWELALVVTALLPFFVFAAFRFSLRIRSQARKQREAYGRIVASVQESFAGISQVKTFAQEKAREKLIGKSVSKDVSANVKTTRLTANYERVVEIINALGICLVLWLGVKEVLSSQISAGDLLVFLAYLQGIYRPLKGIADLTGRIAKATVRGDKLVELLELKPEVEEVEEGISAKGIKGDIRFEKVNFSYVDGVPILRNFSCSIPPLKTTLILGPTGAGKSTVAKLTLRLYNQQSGEIYLDNRNIKDYRIRSIRKQITPLSQETFLFRMSIGENIGFGKRKATQEEIENAARLVGADEFVKNLPDGYNTLVGEGGFTLSGGQRQRISFARAALRQSPVMIFDEPATGLDVHAEKEAKDLLSRFRQNKTIIIITHRLHFLDLADWVVFLKNGSVIEEGPPEELLKRQGKFHEFFSSGKSFTNISEEFVRIPLGGQK